MGTGEKMDYFGEKNPRKDIWSGKSQRNRRMGNKKMQCIIGETFPETRCTKETRVGDLCGLSIEHGIDR